jgi:hypothetical protein
MQQIYPYKTLSGFLGKASRVWKKLFVEMIEIPEMSTPSGNPPTNSVWLYAKDTGAVPGLYFEDDAGSVTQIATTPTALDDVGDPDGAGSITCGTNAQVITSAKTDGDMFNIQGLGNFGDVSVLRVESKTGNPTDGTVLEVVSHDANVDPLLVSALSKANAFKVGQDGNCSMSDNLAVTGTLAVTGAQTLTGLTTCTAGAVLGTDKIITETLDITSAQVKALKATPLAITAAPGAGNFIQFLGATLALDYGSNGFTESSDNLVIEYETSGVDASAAIETTGFLDQTADMITTVIPAAIAAAVPASFSGKKLMLFNSGDGEIAGNAANDSVLRISVTYAVRALGL